MRPLRIDDPGDPRLDDYRAMSDADLIRNRGLFIAEGRLVVQRLLDDGRAVMRSVLVSEAGWHALQPVLERVPGTVPVYICDRTDFLAITGFNIHRGCLALAERFPDVPLDRLFHRRTLVALENVTNADNVGGVFRNVAAFGAGGVVLDATCCDPLYRKAIRTSMAATLRVPFVRVEQWPDAIDTLKAQGFSIVALTPRLPSITLGEFVAESRPDRLVILIGTEGTGLSDEAERKADVRVRIPIHAAVDSLNLTVAVGIALARLSEEAPL